MYSAGVPLQRQIYQNPPGFIPLQYLYHPFMSSAAAANVYYPPPNLHQSVNPFLLRSPNHEQAPLRPMVKKSVEPLSTNGYPLPFHPQNYNLLPPRPPSQHASPQPMGQKPVEAPKDPSIAATSKYLSDYATTVDNVLRKTISNISPTYILEPRRMSIGEIHCSQENVYKFVEKIIAEIKEKQNKIFLRYAYITKTDAECFLKLAYIDSKKQALQSVLYFRNGELERVTLFGPLETQKAWKAFEARNEYESETIFFRKATEYLNEVLYNFKLRNNDPEKLFKCVIAFLGQFLKIQKMPCRICQTFIKNDEVPTIFSGIALGNVSVSHPCCVTRENFI
uniref:Uncharacterized protein n=1 Tax=Panagrolaimus sp. ES5 TaxID=591445 RepID=A0AC34GAX1_9BILA